MGRNKFISCSICQKQLRSDKIKNHTHGETQKSVQSGKHCTICQKSILSKNFARHVRKHAERPLQNVIKYNMKQDLRDYEETKKKGEIIMQLVDKDDIDPSGLRREYVSAMELSFSQPSPTSLDGVVLKPWQKKLLEVLKPDDRTVNWVVGKEGAEGKTWFQEYLVNQEGPIRVFNSSITHKSESILHTLSKYQLSLVKIFIFNVSRSFKVEDIPYSIFEEIKDGKAVSPKYDSRQLRFNVPNTILIFSNELPLFEKMSKDRWNIFTILCNNELKQCKHS